MLHIFVLGDGHTGDVLYYQNSTNWTLKIYCTEYKWFKLKWKIFNYIHDYIWCKTNRCFSGKKFGQKADLGKNTVLSIVLSARCKPDIKQLFRTLVS